MVCPTCGVAFEGAGSFCPHCGSRVVFQAGPGGVVPPGPAYGMPPYAAVPSPVRVQRNLGLLSILWWCLAAYKLATGLIGLFAFRMMAHGGFFGHHFPFDSDRMPFMSAIVPFSLVTTLAFVGLTALVGYGLLQRRPWGRTLAIVMSILSMVTFPLGTALGIYTLWVLAPAMSAMEYEMIADRTTPGF